MNLFIRDKKDSDATYDTEKEKAARSLFGKLIEDIGNMPIGEITYDHAKRFRETLKLMPKVQTTKERKNLSVKQLIALSDPNKISANTAGQRLNSISSLFNWLVLKNANLVNPFKGVTAKDKQKAMNKRLPFNGEDLQAIFNDRIWKEKDFNSDWEYWLPLLLLHTGARVNEICQLEKKDIDKTSTGTSFISINDEPTTSEPEDVWSIARKRVKTVNSRRNIPIHSKLIALGFLDFVEKSKPGLLFPNIKPQGGKLAKYPCRRFNEFILPRTGVKTDKKTFYSFRHTTLNVLKVQGVHIEKRAQLAGHTTGSVTGDTYGEEYDIDLMKEIVEKLDFSNALEKVLHW